MKNRLLILSLIPVMLFATGCNKFEEVFGDEFDKAMIAERDVAFDYQYDVTANQTFNNMILNCSDTYKSAKVESLSIDSPDLRNTYKSHYTYDINIYKSSVMSQKEYSANVSTNSNTVKRTTNRQKESFSEGDYLINRVKVNGRTSFGLSSFSDTMSIRQAATVNKERIADVINDYGLDNFRFGKSNDNISGVFTSSTILPHDTVEGAYSVITSYCYFDLGSVYSPRLQSLEMVSRQFTNYFEGEKQFTEVLTDISYSMTKVDFSYGELEEYGDYNNLTKALYQFVISDVSFSVTKGGASSDTTNLPILKLEQDEESIYAVVNLIKEKNTYFYVKMTVLLSKHGSSNIMKNIQMTNENTTLPDRYYFDSNGYIRHEDNQFRVDSLSVEISSKYDPLTNEFETTFKVTVI